jgi:hypothetical protein
MYHGSQAMAHLLDLFQQAKWASFKHLLNSLIKSHDKDNQVQLWQAMLETADWLSHPKT